MTTPKAEENSIQVLQEENQRLKRAVEELSVLNELARAIGASINSQEIMNTIIRRSMRAVNAQQGDIVLIDELESTPMKTLVRTMVSSVRGEAFHLNQALLGWMHLNKKPLVVGDPKKDERFIGVEWDHSIRSLVCVPLIVKSEVKGVLTLYNKKGANQFSDNDQRLLAIIAGQSAQVIENARLYEEEQALLRMQAEIKLASRIQFDLLPLEPPQIAGYSIAGKTLPAREVGGDYFDFIQIDNHRLAICLGDVSGKGLPASLLMANLQATLRGQTFYTSSPKECIERCNKLLYHSTSPEKFATLFYALLDINQHVLRFCNAGHENPFHVSGKKETGRLKSGGVPLGMFEEIAYEEDAVALEPGDSIVIYSDGVSEAMNENQELFGEEQIASLLEAHRQDTPTGLIERIIATAKTHSAGVPQTDDITIVVIKRV